MKFANRLTCSLVVASVGLLPTQGAYADLVSTDRALTQKHETVLNLLSRSDVVGQLQTFGLDRRIAEERVAAMTDGEIDALTGKLDPVVGGGVSFVGVVAVLVFLIYWYTWTQRDQK